MDSGQSDLSQLRPLIAGQHAFARLCVSRREGGWELRHAEVVVGMDLPRWTPARWLYEDVAFIADSVSAEALTSWFQTTEPSSLTIGDWQATVPAVQAQTSFRREPSRARHDAAPLPWPTCNYDLYAAPGVTQPQMGGQGFLVGDDCPSLPSVETAFRAFFTGTFSMVGTTGSVPSELARIRVLQQDAWLHRIKVGATHIDVHVGGSARAGTRLELNSSTLQLRKRVGKTGRVRVALPGGLPGDAWLFLSRDRQWLDYRTLGLDVAGRVGAMASGVEVDLTDDPVTEIRALVSAGEGPRIEYKRQLPESTIESKRKVLKTVAAFASQDGGHIIFGVDPDEVTVVGVRDVDVNGVRDRIGQLIRGNVVPPDPDYTVQSVAIDGRMLVVLEIRPSSGRPYGLQFQDKPVEFYVRRGSSTYPATQAEVRAMAQPASQQRGFPGFPLSGSYA